MNSRHNARVSKCRRRRIEAGYCARGWAHGPAAPGRTLCQTCIDSHSEKQRARYLLSNPGARKNRCRGCGSEDHNAHRCPDLARREQQGAA